MRLASNVGGKMDELRERVRERAEDSVEEALGGGDDDHDDHDEDFLSPAAVAERGWSLDDYNDFFADCREAGYDASGCGEMWSDAKDAGIAGGSTAVKPVDESEPDPDTDPDQTDLLMLMEDSDSSDLAAKYLSNPIMDGKIEVVTADSQPGQAMLEELDTVPDVPAHLIASDGGVRVGDLESLIQDNAV